MLSIILYGRNDNHGYQYAKRSALSLNHFANLLTEKDDEIIFVDINTDNNLPTLPESIQDSLTVQCKYHLKIIRVRPDLFKKHTKIKQLLVNEPLARNIAIRRSNPRNRWLLSSNSDIITIQQPNRSIIQALSTLDDGYYVLPRFELPEHYWENNLDRHNPQTNTKILREDAQHLYFNYIVKNAFKFVKFDNPGDFQLLPRKIWIEQKGFNEKMFKGWHLDSNLAMRLYQLGYHPQSFEEHAYIYHCNHTRSATTLHSPSLKKNNWKSCVHNASVFLDQPNWGLAEYQLEKILLPTQNQHLNALKKILPKEPTSPLEHTINFQSFNQLQYQNEHILAFIADHLTHLPKNTRIAYIGENRVLQEYLKQFITNAGFEKELLLDANEKLLDVYIISFDQKTAYKQFLKDIKKLRSNPKNLTCIGINLSHNEDRLFFNFYVSATLSSYCSNVMHGKLNRHTLLNLVTLNYWSIRLKLIALKLLKHSSFSLLRQFILKLKLNCQK